MKRCAVCGDTDEKNVKLAWRRYSDGRAVNICCACAEADKVNDKSIDNFTTEDTLFTGVTSNKERRAESMGHYYKCGAQSAFGGTTVRGRARKQVQR